MTKQAIALYRLLALVELCYHKTGFPHGQDHRFDEAIVKAREALKNPPPRL